jgi:hypothetical protein
MNRDESIGVERKRAERATVLLAALVAFPWPATLKTPDASQHTLPKGTAVYYLVPDSSDDIRAAIDKTVSHMNFIVRGIARGRLTKINPTPQHVRVNVETDTVSVAFDAGNPVVTPTNGDTVAWKNSLTGETNHAHVAVVGDTVRQTITAKDGERENALIFSSDGARLRLRVTVKSHRLPRPLVYELFFREEGAPLSG